MNCIKSILGRGVTKPDHYVQSSRIDQRHELDLSLFLGLVLLIDADLVDPKYDRVFLGSQATNGLVQAVRDVYRLLVNLDLAFHRSIRARSPLQIGYTR